jgi:hypothetical protein
VAVIGGVVVAVPMAAAALVGGARKGISCFCSGCGNDMVHLPCVHWGACVGKP